MKLGLQLATCALLSGCVPQVVVRDQEAACRIARDMGHATSTKDMVELTAPFPNANFYAVRAYRARLATLVMTGFGAAGIGGAFIAGFAADTNKPEVRAGLYADVGVTLGLGAAVLLSGYIYASASRKAVAQLDADVRNTCPQQ
ncbi:MAG: hypothetical protein ABI321_05920 [Polyangia bacterium]